VSLIENSKTDLDDYARLRSVASVSLNLSICHFLPTSSARVIAIDGGRWLRLARVILRAYSSVGFGVVSVERQVAIKRRQVINSRVDTPYRLKSQGDNH